MLPILFLDLDAVLRIHDNQIRLYGGDASVRDEGLLRSALAQPEATFGGQWLHEYPHGMAAAYLFHVVANHPFVDGNKRTGLASSLAFLALNGWRLGASKDDAYELTLGVAQGRVPKDDLIEFFRRHVTR